MMQVSIEFHVMYNFDENIIYIYIYIYIYMNVLTHFRKIDSSTGKQKYIYLIQL